MTSVKKFYKTSVIVFDEENVIATPVARKAIFIGLTLLGLKKFCGLYAMLNYAGQIFKDSGSQLDPNLSAIIVGCIQLVGTYVPTLLVDRAGRKVSFKKRVR